MSLLLELAEIKRETKLILNLKKDPKGSDNMLNQNWTKEEIKLLGENYVEKGAYDLSNLINRSPNAIRIRACFLGIKRLDYRKEINLSEIENQVILGGLLGDLYCRIKKTCKNAQIEGTHCKKQEEYMLWKLSLLKSLSFNLRRTKNGYLFFESKVYPCLNYHHNLFYKNGKKQIYYEILNKLNNLGLAIWYMDDGSYRKKSKDCRIYTNGFTYEENLIIKSWFEKRFDIHPKISIHKDNKRYPGEIWYYLDINVNDTKKLIELIKPYIHPSMRYKIGEENLNKMGNQ